MIGVYSITNTANNKIYIGSSVNISKRFIGHRNALNKGNHENSHLQRAWVKYGIESFSFAVLCEAESGQDVRSLEQQYLDKLTPDSSYNISKNACGASFGEDNPAKREDVRKKISAGLIGKKLTETAKINIGIASSKSWEDPVRKAKMSASMKLTWLNAVWKAKILAARKQAVLLLTKAERNAKWGDPIRGIKRDGTAYTKSITKRWADPEQRLALCAALKGKRKTVTCPHCGLSGGGGNMRRYHFDKCAKK
jgi:group I intron endonuclease